MATELQLDSVTYFVFYYFIVDVPYNQGFTGLTLGICYQQ